MTWAFAVRKYSDNLSVFRVRAAWVRRPLRLDAVSACVLQQAILKQERILNRLCRELGEAAFEPLKRMGGW
jgi:hypothetical protein